MTTPSPLPLDADINEGDGGHLQAHDDLSYYVNQLMTKPHRLLGRSFDGKYVNASFQPNAGQLYVAKIDVPVTGPATNVEVSVSVAGTGATPLANCYAGLYDSTGAQLGVSAEQHTAWATNGIKVCPLAGGVVTLTGGQGYFVYGAFLVGTQSTTKLSFASSSGQGDDKSLNFDQAKPPWNAALGATGLSAMPASFNPATLTSASALILCGIS